MCPRCQCFLQVRTGDTAGQGKGLNEQNQTVQQYQHVFDCAENINRTHHGGGARRVLFYFIADSLSLRQNVEDHYGKDILLTAVKGVEVAHISLNRFGDLDHLRRAMVTAAGELWLFSFTDYQLTSAWSGFGLMGSLWSYGWHNRYPWMMRPWARQACDICLDLPWT